MKKGLLLSVVASTMIFAGGDIAPVEPAAAAPVADCSDFSGVVGVHYQTEDANTDVDVTDNDLFGKDVSSLIFSAKLNVNKMITDNIGFGAEVGGWTTALRDSFRASRRATQEGGALNQLYLAASFNNTAVQVGRFALKSNLSTLLSTGGTGGVTDTTYDGVLVANTDLADTLVYGVWVSAAVKDNNRAKFLNVAGDNTGAFALGFQNKSIANTTITAVGYYGSELGALVAGTTEDLLAGALTVNSVLGDYKVDGQVAYKDDGSANPAIAAAIKFSGSFGIVNAWGGIGYTNNNTVGSVVITGSSTGGLLGDGWDQDFGAESTTFAAGISGKLGIGTASLGANYVDYANDDKRTRVYVGYKMAVKGVGLYAQYRYEDSETAAGVSTKSARVRLGASYKF